MIDRLWVIAAGFTYVGIIIGLGSFVLVVFCAYVLRTAQRNSRTQLAYILIDSRTGKVATSKLANFVGIAFGTYIVVVLTVMDKLNDFTFVTYLGYCATLKVSTDWKERAKLSTRAPQSDVTVNTTVNKES